MLAPNYYVDYESSTASITSKDQNHKFRFCKEGLSKCVAGIALGVQRLKSSPIDIIIRSLRRGSEVTDMF